MTDQSKPSADGRIADWAVSTNRFGSRAERDSKRGSDDATVEADESGLYVQLNSYAPFQGYTATVLIPWPVVDELLRLRAVRQQSTSAAAGKASDADE